MLDFYLSKLNVSVSKPSARASFLLLLSALLGLVRTSLPVGVRRWPSPAVGKRRTRGPVLSLLASPAFVIPADRHPLLQPRRPDRALLPALLGLPGQRSPARRRLRLLPALHPAVLRRWVCGPWRVVLPLGRLVPAAGALLSAEGCTSHPSMYTIPKEQPADAVCCRSRAGGEHHGSVWVSKALSSARVRTRRFLSLPFSLSPGEVNPPLQMA